VDADLVGHESADQLFSIADSYRGNPGLGVYTISEWLTAIYEGRKEPSRSELDEDYSERIKALLSSKKIDDKEAVRMLKDREAKLMFEIENVFPITNKVTCGTISAFGPLLADHNAIKPPQDVILTAEAVRAIIDEIRGIDFSAYYRETRFESEELATFSERLHIEVLPDVILMPNVGLRGIMWQEIEGRTRTTPARMFMPVFPQNDPKTLLIRLTSEFRWEMCRRIQGTRWNDLTDPSLTSEFCDYLQFYRSNRNLSLEVKDIIRNELASARNNYKTVFSSYYSVWILYESQGLARLNKHVRKVMMTYCPFPREMREKLFTNPQFTEALNRYNNRSRQRVKTLTNMVQKITQSGKKAPKELLDEKAFAGI
jgi:hypothetical protein